jgi:hypothetical protein
MEARAGLPAAEEDCGTPSSSLISWVRDRRTLRTETVARAGRREVCQWCNYAIIHAIHQRVLALHRSRSNLLPGGQVPVPQRRVLEPEPRSSTKLRNSRQRYSYVYSDFGYVWDICCISLENLSVSYLNTMNINIKELILLLCMSVKLDLSS